jgi:hypothetical protein
MVYLSKFVHSNTGKIMMSILLGFGLATLFRAVCKGKGCLEFYAPSLDEINNKIYKIGNKCYKYTPKASKCDNSKKIVDFV